MTLAVGPAPRWRLFPIAPLLGAVFVFASCTASTATDAPGATTPGSTTAPTPSVIDASGAPAPAGTLIDAAPIDALPGQRAWRISYHSRDRADRDIAVTGLLVAPDDERTDRPLITYGHPTTGLADACTPSWSGVRSLPATDGFTAHGWALVMSDFPGLGTDAPHPYLVGVDEGRSMLDAARAARQVTGSGVGTASPVAIVGFSQGGHAAAFAAQEAPTYAPDLAVDGLALAAPVSDVEHFIARAEGMSEQLGVVVAIVAGFTGAYPELDARAVLTDPVADDLGIVERRCIGDLNIDLDRPIPQVVRTPATAQPAYLTRFTENQAGNGPVAQPVLVVQGDQDPIVAPADSHALVRRWCAQGTAVQEVVVAGAQHGVMTAEPFASWLTDRFAGRPPASTC